MYKIIELLFKLLLGIDANAVCRARFWSTGAVRAGVHRAYGLLQLDAVALQLVESGLDLVEFALDLLGHAQTLVAALLFDAVLVTSTGV